MKRPSIVLLSLAIPTMAFVAPQPTQFAEIVRRQTASSTISIPPPPAESTGCTLHIDHYHCDGPASGALAASGTIAIPAPPAESTGCVLHDDHYHCEGLASGHTAEGDNDDHGYDHDQAVSGRPASSGVASQARDVVSTSAAVSSSMTSIAVTVSAAAAQSSGAAIAFGILPSKVTFGLVLSAAGMIAGVGHILA